MQARAGLLGMGVRVVRGVAAVGTGFGFEGRIEFADLQTQARQHLPEHRVGLDAQGAWQQLYGDMAIAQMVGRTGQQQGVVAARLGHALGGGAHFDHFTVPALQQIAAAQNMATIQEQTDFFATVEAGAQPTLASGLETQREPVRG